MSIDPDKVYLATFETTKGDILVELYSQEAPTAANNFVVLANLGFFDGMPLLPAGPPSVPATLDPCPPNA